MSSAWYLGELSAGLTAWFGGRRVEDSWPVIPAPVQSMQDYLISQRDLIGHFQWSMLVVVALIALLIWLSRYQRRRTVAVVSTDKPEQIFDDLLKKLNLDAADRNLLQQLASEARLRHPVMCLLSPGLLEWGRNVWLAEKGPEKVTAEVTGHLYEISAQLHGFRPRTTTSA